MSQIKRSDKVNLHGIRYGRGFLAFHAESCNLENTTINILLGNKDYTKERRIILYYILLYYIERYFQCWILKTVLLEML